MSGLFYRFLAGVARTFGPWPFAIVSRFIACGYFLFSGLAPESRRFYRILYPEKSVFYHLRCAFRQYQNFTTVYLDRLLAGQRAEISFTSQGWEYLEAALGGRGGVVLMSHLGNWEVAAHLLRRQHEGLRLLLYMGIKDKEEIERIQKQSLRESGIRIVGVDRRGGSPLDVVEGMHWLKSGGLVSLAGDVVWRGEQRTVEVEFLGRRVLLPEAPYILALVSGAPLFVFFTFRTGPGRYHFTVSEPIYIRPASRAQRGETIRRAARQYAGLLEKNLRAHPFEWYHFDRFLLEAEVGSRREQ